ncbi:substrate-binding periplasmic protein [Magnetococcus sp. PR-3]|uniref:substrate-binding periplasmic protein n=1 Tax=Magnetococcus sp. PR-3 TaxID=3120355 RepID=UPI002FCE19DB
MRLLLLPALLLLLLSPAQADDQPLSIELGFGIVGGFIEEDYSGPGYAFLEEVTKRLKGKGYEIHTQLLPFKRLITAFNMNKMDVLFPIITSGDLPSGGYAKWGYLRIPLSSMPLYNGGEFVIYTRKDQPKRDNVESLKDLHVGIMTGIYIPTVLLPPSTYNVTEIYGAEQAFKMLHAGRMDALVMHNQWAGVVLDKMAEAEELHHGQAFGAILGGFLTQQDERGARILAHINQSLAEMMMDGTWNKILDQYPNAQTLVRPPQ